MTLTWLPAELRPLSKHLRDLGRERELCCYVLDRGRRWLTNGHFAVRTPSSWVPPVSRADLDVRLCDPGNVFDPLGREFRQRVLVEQSEQTGGEDVYRFGEAHVSRAYVNAIERCRFVDPQRIHWAAGPAVEPVLGYVGATTRKLELVAMVMPIKVGP